MSNTTKGAPKADAIVLSGNALMRLSQSQESAMSAPSQSVLSMFFL
jgi:hypothetical protein